MASPPTVINRTPTIGICPTPRSCNILGLFTIVLLSESAACSAASPRNPDVSVPACSLLFFSCVSSLRSNSGSPVRFLKWIRLSGIPALRRARSERVFSAITSPFRTMISTGTSRGPSLPVRKAICVRPAAIAAAGKGRGACVPHYAGLVGVGAVRRAGRSCKMKGRGAGGGIRSGAPARRRSSAPGMPSHARSAATSGRA